MPLTHVRTFRVRYYECDAYGRVNHTNYLRYMQEAAFDASATAGYGPARYAAMRRNWLVRETDIEINRPLRYGDSVQVKTWVAEFRRVRSRRMYELRLVGSGELVARAHTDWAFLDSTSGRPAPIPQELVTTFFPDGPPDIVPPHSRFPSSPPPPPGVFRRRRQVEWQDIDAAQHVNNAVYLTYMEDCGMRAEAAHGWPMARMQAKGYAIVARRHQIEYRQPALLGDELELASWLSDVERTSVVRHITTTRVGDGALLARARSLLGWIDAETEGPVPIPSAFLEELAPNITSLRPESA
jgi:YbgC/YbaW family acyl-CoA thioester hydrolase